jgi:hypothetical protein
MSACGGPTASPSFTTSTAAGPAPVVSAPAVNAGAAYVVSTGVTPQGVDNPAFARLPNASADVALGRTVPFAGIGSDALMLMTAEGTIRVTRATRPGTPVYSRERSGNPPVALATADALYVVEGGAMIVVDGVGTTRTVTLPVASPGGPTVTCTSRGARHSTDSALRSLTAVNAQAYAFVSTWFNGLLVDLATGRTLELKGSGPAISMTAGPNGHLYALTQDPGCDTSNWLVREIDVVAMREVRVIDTGVPGGPYVHLGLVASRAGVFFHVVGDTAAYLSLIDALGRQPAVTVPEPAGIRAAGAPDGSIYIFGGRAREIVRRFDPVTRSFAEVASLRGPPGSFVNAVFFLP